MAKMYPIIPEFKFPNKLAGELLALPVNSQEQI